MKTYEKPKLIALSLSGNNMLCNTCAVDIIAPYPDENQGLVEMLETFYGPVQSLFAAYESCTVKPDITGYCKFTGAESGEKVVINS